MHTKQHMAVATAALALVFPLAACGSDDEGASGGLSTAAEAPSSTSAAETSSDASAENTEDTTKTETTTKSSAKDKAQGGEKAGNQAQQDNNGDQPPTLVNPFENGIPQNTNQPLASGKEGSEKDRKEMEATARTVLNPGSFADWTPTILENSCKAVTEPMLEEIERQGMTLEQINEASRLAEEQGQGIELPKTEVSLTDVRVDGDRASGTLTAKSDQGEDTQTMIFQKEDGRWKLCN